MAPQKRASRTTAKKSKLSTSRRSTPRKATATTTRRKRTVTATSRPSARKGGVIKQTIKKGISELSKLGS